MVTSWPGGEPASLLFACGARLVPTDASRQRPRKLAPAGTGGYQKPAIVGMRSIMYVVYVLRQQFAGQPPRTRAHVDSSAQTVPSGTLFGMTTCRWR